MFFRFVLHSDNSTKWEDISMLEVIGNGTLASIFKDFFLATTMILIPIVSLLGIAGNTISMWILYRHGLGKCSNVLIFALAVADTTYLIGTNNVPLQVYTRSNASYGFFCSENLGFFLYILVHVFILLETVGKVVSMILPTLIIFERLVAVFWPLHFSRVLTARRIQLAAVLMYPFGVPPYVLYSRLFQFVYAHDKTSDSGVGLLVRSPNVNHDAIPYNILSGVYTTVCGPICVGVVMVGCVLVGVKVRVQLQNRGKMTSHLTPDSKRADVTRMPAWRSTNQRTGRYDLSIISEQGLFSVVGRVDRYSRNQEMVAFSRDDVKSRKDETNASSKPLRHNLGRVSGLKVDHNSPTQTSPSENRSRSSLITRKRLRTTKILLSVCIVYSVTGTLSFLSDMVFTSELLGYLPGLMIHRSAMLALCVNSAANFLIYVVFNENFRQTYKEIFCGWCSSRWRF